MLLPPPFVMQAPPSQAQVDRVEAAALKDPCVRPIDQLWRSYVFEQNHGPEGQEIDRNVIVVFMIDADHSGHKAGQAILAFPAPPIIDDSQYRLAFGRYDLRKQRFTQWFCGMNLRGDPK